jgi:hypothetical protein
MLRGLILEHVAVTVRRIASALTVGTQFVFGMKHAAGQLAPAILNQIGGIVIGGRNLGIEQGQCLGSGHVIGQHTIGGGDIAHAGPGRGREKNGRKDHCVRAYRSCLAGSHSMSPVFSEFIPARSGFMP